MATGSISDRYLQGMNQAKHRGVAVWFDQHKSSTFRNAQGEAIFENGRPYHSIVELKTKMPVGPVMPLGWSAPIEVPQQYVIRAIGKATNLPQSVGMILTNVVTDRIRIDYAQMYTDDRQAAVEHWRAAVKFADAKGWEPPKFGHAMDPRLLAIVGPAPRSPKIAQALQAGNPWALGMKMPTRDPVTGQMRVEEDEALVRLLLLNRGDVLTPDEVEREEEAAGQRKELASPDVLAEARAIVEEYKRLVAEAKAEKAGTAKRSDTAKPKKAERTPEQKAADAARMAKARASKKAPPAPAHAG